MCIRFLIPTCKNNYPLFEHFTDRTMAIITTYYFEMDPVVTVHAPELIAALDSQAIVVAVTQTKN